MGISQYSGVDIEKPLEGNFLRGKVIELNDETMRLHYGIEQFFFERNLEIPTVNLTVHARVSTNGQARIVDLLYNGKPIEKSSATKQ